LHDRWFDEFATAVSSKASRRQLLKVFAAGSVASLFGRTPALGEANAPLTVQPTDEPLPNFPFLIALPTDPGLEQYKLDVGLTGPPTRIQSLSAFPSLPQDWLDAVSKCRGGYFATISQPKKDAPSEPERSITTILFDVGTAEAATSTFDAYVAKILSNSSRQVLGGGTQPAGGGDVVLIGCEGGCVDFRSPADGGTAPTDEVATVGHQDRFVFDARIREFSSQSITAQQAATVGLGLNVKLGAVGAIGGTGTTYQRSAGLLKRVLSTLAGSTAFTRRSLLQSSSDDIRLSLASKSTLPLFGVDGVEPPISAVQWLRVDDGEVVVRFGQSESSLEADQLTFSDVVFALALDQPLSITQPLLGGYELNISARQLVFNSEEDARKFLVESEERIARTRPNLTLIGTFEDEDELSFAYRNDKPAKPENGPTFGLLTHELVSFGSLTAIILAELIAVPVALGQAPLGASELEQHLGPILDQIMSTLSNCLINPDTCPAKALLNAPTLVAPTPTACPAGQQICGDLCIDTSSDPANCGGCQTVCAQGAVCANGSCVCASGSTYCSAIGICVDLSSDPNNCGDCGIGCPSGWLCANGQCVCPDGSPPCGGSCCEPGWVCTDGTCAPPCPSGQIQCSGTCVDQYYDPVNCGDCGVDCAGLSCCGGFCVDTGSDPANCGGCGGNCGGLNCCGGQCIDVSSDPANCGGCGVTCDGLSCCGGGCVDLMTDAANCGGCGVDCGSGWYCSGGDCYPNLT
jgi:hypothetical protein